MASTEAFGRPAQRPFLLRLQESRGALGFVFLLPAAVLLLLFLTYPLGLGVWLGFTDERIGRPGIFIGLENYVYLWSDAVFWLSVFNTLLYTVTVRSTTLPSRTSSRSRRAISMRAVSCRSM